ncbi:hypothetical protein HYZ78_01685 [Candidatus Microgenomates bacterium]|nr:hypothetical protein [Candidatus Microgenomates bacterium]
MRNRKNFLPALLIAFFLWITLALVIIKVSPDVFWAPPLVFVLFFPANLFTASILTNRLMGFVISILITLVFLFMFLGFRI